MLIFRSKTVVKVLYHNLFNTKWILQTQFSMISWNKEILSNNIIYFLVKWKKIFLLLYRTTYMLEWSRTKASRNYLKLWLICLCCMYRTSFLWYCQSIVLLISDNWFIQTLKIKVKENEIKNFFLPYGTRRLSCKMFIWE